jgi:hypothetical protein
VGKPLRQQVFNVRIDQKRDTYAQSANKKHRKINLDRCKHRFIKRHKHQPEISDEQARIYEKNLSK